ncbi:hypothetical protein [Mesorhizobium sp. CO1-1-7]|uniref:hypothetical protein n=1 Tax=Mesorhizobium sp. CO1-1-7 TaxID=2876632 RepID=UPI001CD1764C|nr:hypothetical protein [Mesorhizobium sp. CO1-1-7]
MSATMIASGANLFRSTGRMTGQEHSGNTATQRDPFKGVERVSPTTSDVGRAKIGNPATGMARCIERHRRLVAAVERFSRKRCASRFSLLSAAAWLALVVSRPLERSAWRRLVQRKPVESCEAEQKILYLIAAILARKTHLRPAEVDEVKASVMEFQSGIADLLRRKDP